MSTQPEADGVDTTCQLTHGQEEEDPDTVTFDVTEALKEWSTGESDDEFPPEIDSTNQGPLQQIAPLLIMLSCYHSPRATQSTTPVSSAHSPLPVDDSIKIQEMGRAITRT